MSTICFRVNWVVTSNLANQSVLEQFQLFVNCRNGENAEHFMHPIKKTAAVRPATVIVGQLH